MRCLLHYGIPIQHLTTINLSFDYEKEFGVEEKDSKHWLWLERVTALRDLNLSRRWVGENGLEVIARVCPNLQRLNLEHCKKQYLALSALECLRSCRNLNRIAVRGVPDLENQTFIINHVNLLQ